MPGRIPRLAFENVSVAPRGGDDPGLARVSFALHPGELMVVDLEEGGWNGCLADAAMGLAAPEAGAVLFDGADWSAMRPDRAAACRARIGRVFASWAWVSNLTVSENVLLARLNHTKLPLTEIEARAGRLARAFGLPGLPRERSHKVAPRDLRRAEWVRALVGEPDLLVLEQPLDGVPDDLIPPLAEAAGRRLEHGAAVLWIGRCPPLAGSLGAAPGGRFVLRGSALTPLSEAV